MEAMSKIFKTTRLNLDFPYNNVNLTKLAQKPIAEYDESIDKMIIKVTIHIALCIIFLFFIFF